MITSGFIFLLLRPDHKTLNQAKFPFIGVFKLIYMYGPLDESYHVSIYIYDDSERSSIKICMWGLGKMSTLNTVWIKLVADGFAYISIECESSGLDKWEHWGNTVPEVVLGSSSVSLKGGSTLLPSEKPLNNTSY